MKNWLDAFLRSLRRRVYGGRVNGSQMGGLVWADGYVASGQEQVLTWMGCGAAECVTEGYAPTEAEWERLMAVVEG